MLRSPRVSPPPPIPSGSPTPAVIATERFTLVALPRFALVLTAVLRSPWPVLIALALLAALAARTALKANWKSHDKLALVLYGIHSHFQQIPIYVGQLQFHRSRRTGKRTALVEYKS